MSYRTLIITLQPIFFTLACTHTVETGPVLAFEDMDTSSNGYISMSEAKASTDIANNFKKIDSDSDGNIDITEYQIYMGKGRMTPPEEMETPEPGAAPY